MFQFVLFIIFILDGDGDKYADLSVLLKAVFV